MCIYIYTHIHIWYKIQVHDERTRRARDKRALTSPANRRLPACLVYKHVAARGLHPDTDRVVVVVQRFRARLPPVA